MSNAFMGQRQQASPMGYGGYSGGYSPPQRIEPSYGGYDPFGGGGYGGGMGGYNPFGGGGYGTQFGGYDMGGGGGFGGYGGGMRAPAYEPTINDAFSRYFSQQYYGGPAFDPFAATSFFGGGYGGGFGYGGGGRRGGGMGGRMRRRRQMFEDLFQPEITPLPQPQPMPIGGGAAMPTTGGGGVQMGGGIGGGGLYGGGGGRMELKQGMGGMPTPLPPETQKAYDQYRATRGVTEEMRETDTSEYWDRMAKKEQPNWTRSSSQSLSMGGGMSGFGGFDPVMGGGYSSGMGAYTPQPYMGGFSFPFDQALPAKSEAPSAPAVQGFDSIMPVQMQDTPVQSAPAYAPAPYTPPAPTYTEPMQYTPPAPSYAEPIQYIPPAPTYMEPMQYTPPAPSYAEPIQYIPPAPSYMEPEQYIPLNIAPRFSPFARSSREMLELDF
jgi:hypothetical protein